MFTSMHIGTNHVDTLVIQDLISTGTIIIRVPDVMSTSTSVMMHSTIKP